MSMLTIWFIVPVSMDPRRKHPSVRAEGTRGIEARPQPESHPWPALRTLAYGNAKLKRHGPSLNPGRAGPFYRSAATCAVR